MFLSVPPFCLLCLGSIMSSQVFSMNTLSIPLYISAYTVWESPSWSKWQAATCRHRRAKGRDTAASNVPIIFQKFLYKSCKLGSFVWHLCDNSVASVLLKIHLYIKTPVTKCFKGRHDSRCTQIQGITTSRHVASCLNASCHKKWTLSYFYFHLLTVTFVTSGRTCAVPSCCKWQKSYIGI